MSLFKNTPTIPQSALPSRTGDNLTSAALKRIASARGGIAMLGTIPRSPELELERIERDLAHYYDRIHDHLGNVGPVPLRYVRQACKELNPVRELLDQLPHNHVLVAERALAILERNNLHIIDNPAGKGHLLISTRF